MNKFVVISAIFYVLAVNGAEIHEERLNQTEEVKETFPGFLMEVVGKFTGALDKLSDKVTENCPDIVDKMDEASKEVDNCVRNIQGGSDTVCTIAKNYWPKCTKPMRDIVTSCFPPESKEIPFMFEKVVLDLADQICASTVEEVLEILNPCVLNANPVASQVCQDLKTSYDEYKNELLTKSLACGAVSKMRNCGKSLLELSCKNPKTINANDKLFATIEKAIKNDCDALNNH